MGVGGWGLGVRVGLVCGVGAVWVRCGCGVGAVWVRCGCGVGAVWVLGGTYAGRGSMFIF